MSEEIIETISSIKIHKMHDMLYYIIVSITTVGYGDESPQGNAGRVVIMVMMAAAVLTVPRQTNRLVALLAQQSQFANHVYRPSRTSQHIIVGGNLGSYVMQQSG